MKNLTRRNSGFTLIEIIVVLIIVGVLAAIALPNLFSNINRSRGAEALASLGPMKSQLEGCGQKTSPANFSSCGTSTLGVSGAFSYGLSAGNCTVAPVFTTAAVGGASAWCVKAQSTANTANFIRLERIDTAPTTNVTCFGAGLYAGIC